MTFILGINAFHADAAAALIHNGSILGAAEEERFTRTKHWAGFPINAIKWCLTTFGISISDITHIAINTNPRSHRIRKYVYSLTNHPDPRFLFARWKNKRERSNLPQLISSAFPDNSIQAQYHFIDHHYAHLASAFFASTFDRSSVISVDGFGDFASGARGYGKGPDLFVHDKIFFPHSLGAFYTAITQFLGFNNYGDEYKVMGLAPYGKPTYINEMREVVKLDTSGNYKLNLKYFQHHSKNLPHQWSSGIPVVGQHWSPELQTLLGSPRLPDQPLLQIHNDIAHSAQKMYEEAFFHLLNSLYSEKPSVNLCIAGGCGANSVANGKITEHTPYKNIYVQAAAGDAGGALGASLAVWHKLGNTRSLPMTTAYLGSSASNHELQEIISLPEISKSLSSNQINYKFLLNNQILNYVTDSICSGYVVGWFEGSMEWGPRALGHRSILGDPRRNDMKDILNRKIKKRESFRPFAPSVLREHVNEWFEHDADVPFMMKVFPVREEKRALVPAITHVDGTGRLQTVTESQNGRYYELIHSFFERTGVPMLLNTSFNENEPIVRTPIEAFNCFIRTNMDLLIIDDLCFSRHPIP